MTFSVRISQQANGDIREARDWYEEQLGGLGEEFGRELDTVLSQFYEQPAIYPIVYRNVRRALTRRFPYAIYFVAEVDRITVLRGFSSGVPSAKKPTRSASRILTTSSNFEDFSR